MIINLHKTPLNDVIWDDYIAENFAIIEKAFRGLAGSINPDVMGEIQAITVNNEAVQIVNKTVNINIPYKINELKDVRSTNPKKDQALLWSPDEQKYVNKDIQVGDEKVKLNKDGTANYLDALIGKTLKVKDGLLEVSGIDGMTVTIANINQLAGIEKPIKPILDAIGNAMFFDGTSNTYDELKKVPNPKNGAVRVVLNDENNKNQQYTYVYVESKTRWEAIASMSIQIRDFTVDPIDLTKEVTGKLPLENIDTDGLVTKNDIKDFITQDDADDRYIKIDTENLVIRKNDIVDDWESNNTDKPASASVVKRLKELYDSDKNATNQIIENMESRINEIENKLPDDSEDEDSKSYISGIKRNGTLLPTYDDGTVNVIVPTVISELVNDSKFVDEDKVKQLIKDSGISDGDDEPTPPPTGSIPMSSTSTTTDISGGGTETITVNKIGGDTTTTTTNKDGDGNVLSTTIVKENEAGTKETYTSSSTTTTDGSGKKSTTTISTSSVGGITKTTTTTVTEDPTTGEKTETVEEDANGDDSLFATREDVEDIYDNIFTGLGW